MLFVDAIVLILFKNEPTCLDWLDLDDSDELVVISGDVKGNIFKWNMNTNSYARYFPENKPITQLRTCKNKYLVSVGYKHGSIVILDVEKNEKMKIVYKLKSHEDAINYLYWNPVTDGDNFFKIKDESLVLCSSSEDKTIRFWSMEDGSQLKVLNAPTSSNRHQNRQNAKINFTPLCWATSRYVLSSSYKLAFVLPNLIS